MHCDLSKLAYTGCFEEAPLLFCVALLCTDLPCPVQHLPHSVSCTAHASRQLVSIALGSKNQEPSTSSLLR